MTIRQPCPCPGPRRVCAQCERERRHSGGSEPTIHVVCDCGERFEWDPRNPWTGEIPEAHPHDHECEHTTRYQSLADAAVSGGETA